MSNQKFTFSLTIGKDSFSFDNKELVSSSWQKKKKKSPSQLRREAKRREEHVSRAPQETTVLGDTVDEVVVEVTEPVENNETKQQAGEASKFNCDECHFKSVSAKGLKQHIRVKHPIGQFDGADDVVSETNDSDKNLSLGGNVVAIPAGKSLGIFVEELRKLVNMKIKQAYKLDEEPFVRALRNNQDIKNYLDNLVELHSISDAKKVVSRLWETLQEDE